MLARALLYQGRPREGEADLRRVLAEQPDQAKAMAYLGEMLYYQGRFSEAERIFARSVELGRGTGMDEPVLLSAFLYASRGERNRIDPMIFRLQPADIIDGDTAYWLGELTPCSATSRRRWFGSAAPLSGATTTIPGSNVTRTSRPCVMTPNISESCQKCAKSGSSTGSYSGVPVDKWGARLQQSTFAKPGPKYGTRGGKRNARSLDSRSLGNSVALARDDTKKSVTAPEPS